jgi:hypothetical protein
MVNFFSRFLHFIKNNFDRLLYLWLVLALTAIAVSLFSIDDNIDSIKWNTRNIEDISDELNGVSSNLDYLDYLRDLKYLKNTDSDWLENYLNQPRS